MDLTEYQTAEDKSGLQGNLLNLYSQERQSRIDEAFSESLTSVALDGKDGGIRSRKIYVAKAAKAEKRRTKRAKRSSSRPDVDNRGFHANDSKTVAAHFRRHPRHRWSIEEAEWVYTRMFIENLVNFDDISRQMKVQFDIDRSLRALPMIQLHWKAPDPSPEAWSNNSDQCLWIFAQAKKGIP